MKRCLHFGAKPKQLHKYSLEMANFIIIIILLALLHLYRYTSINHCLFGYFLYKIINLNVCHNFFFNSGYAIEWIAGFWKWTNHRTISALENPNK